MGNKPRMLTYCGETWPIAEWADAMDITPEALRHYLLTHTMDEAWKHYVDRDDGYIPQNYVKRTTGKSMTEWAKYWGVTLQAVSVKFSCCGNWDEVAAYYEARMKAIADGKSPKGGRKHKEAGKRKYEYSKNPDGEINDPLTTYTYHGETHSLTEWSRIFDVDREGLRKYVKRSGFTKAAEWFSGGENSKYRKHLKEQEERRKSLCNKCQWFQGAGAGAGTTYKSCSYCYHTGKTRGTVVNGKIVYSDPCDKFTPKTGWRGKPFHIKPI